MLTLKQSFGHPVGYSDHTPGIEVPVAAAALGATVIEKHLTLDRKAAGPDHAASSDPDEFAALVRAIRNVEASLGDGIKRPAPCEVANIVAARKSIVAAHDMPAGTVVREADLVIKRPGSGILPALLPEVVGLKLTRDVACDHVLTWNDFKNA
jgi:N-acetylneuraminate synthase/N,N'-diacetyllegionaminate synthase